MADVKKTRRSAHRLVFLKNGTVLDGHFPPGKIHQTGALGGVKIAKRCAFKIAHGWVAQQVRQEARRATKKAPETGRLKLQEGIETNYKAVW
jgi:hypothetical protein